MNKHLSDMVDSALGFAPWDDDLQRNGSGTIRANLTNALIALRGDERWQGVLGFDEMAQQTMLRRPIPVAKGGRELPAGGFEPRALRDADVTAALEWIQRTAIPNMGIEAMWQAVEVVARENRFHPVRDWLDGLEWDGIPRAHDWLHYYAGAERTAYVMAIGRMMLVALVARVFDPGCKVDYVPILEGPQGAKKSTLCRIMGGECFDDNLPESVNSKDSAAHLRGKWLIELGEVTALTKNEAANLKAFVTREVDRYRPAYGRQEVAYPRQCVFWGTTNKAQYLRDETGGRRFWPVKVGDAIDVEALAHDRDQLLAEAVSLYRSGAEWWPDAAFEREHIAPQQEERFEEDAWESAIKAWLETATHPRTVTEIGEQALGLDKSRMGTAENRRILAILHRLGCQRRFRRGRKLWALPSLWDPRGVEGVS